MPRGIYKRDTPIERFWKKVSKTDNCWLWIAGKFYTGYGAFYVKPKLLYAHRYSYELYKGQIPEGLQIDHLCRVRHCVNPNHLEVVTAQENMARGINATKTHCKRGHEFTEENTYLYKKQRHCKKCDRIRHDRIQQKQHS